MNTILNQPIATLNQQTETAETNTPVPYNNKYTTKINTQLTKLEESKVSTARLNTRKAKIKNIVFSALFGIGILAVVVFAATGVTSPLIVILFAAGVVAPVAVLVPMLLGIIFIIFGMLCGGGSGLDNKKDEKAELNQLKKRADELSDEMSDDDRISYLFWLLIDLESLECYIQDNSENYFLLAKIKEIYADISTTITSHGNDNILQEVSKYANELDSKEDNASLLDMDNSSTKHG